MCEMVDPKEEERALRGKRSGKDIKKPGIGQRQGCPTLQDVLQVLLEDPADLW
jgi:hypothetical protein